MHNFIGWIIVGMIFCFFGVFTYLFTMWTFDMSMINWYFVRFIMCIFTFIGLIHWMIVPKEKY